MALGSDVFPSQLRFHFPSRPVRNYYGPAPIHSRYVQAQFYDPFSNTPPQWALYRSYYTPYRHVAPYRYVGSQYLAEQSTTLPLGWNRYYLAARLQAPYSLIIRNSPQYSSYRDPDSGPTVQTAPPGNSPVTVHTLPLRGDRPAPQPRTIEISSGMTEEQVKSRLGPPMIQVVLGDTRSFVYDMLRVEFEKGRVRNVVFK